MMQKEEAMAVSENCSMGNHNWIMPFDETSYIVLI